MVKLQRRLAREAGKVQGGRQLRARGRFGRGWVGIREEKAGHGLELETNGSDQGSAPQEGKEIKARDRGKA